MNRVTARAIPALLAVVVGAACSKSPPVAPSPGSPASPESLVLFDAGHFNYHRLNTTYAAFERFLRGDGWSVDTLPGGFDLVSLRRGRILVISNALAQQNANPNNWTLPTPSAFSSAEMGVVRDWVESGGGLLLITDHMPFPGAAEQLAAAFGVRLNNGFAFDARQLTVPNTCLAESEIHVFRRADGTLADHPITSGIDSVATFTGSAFETDATPLMTFNATSVSLLPQTAWIFTAATPRISAAGWYQGAVKPFGRGRVAVFGEAAMFSEQTCGSGVPMGMNSPVARENGRFVLNVIRWLAGRIG